MEKKNLISAIGRQKNHKKPVIGCFPLYPPLEIFTSMGLLPVVLWNLKGDVQSLEKSDRHIQSYACGIARELVQFLMSDSGNYIDGIFSYNACDTLRNLPEVISSGNASKGRKIPMFAMHVPQVNREQTDPEKYLKNEICLLIEDIEKSYGLPFSSESFKATTVLYTRMRKLCLDAEDLVAKGLLSFSEFCGVLLSSYFLPIEEQISNLDLLISRAQASSASKGTGVIVSGIMPPPVSVINAMEKAGLRVVANDIASLKRSYGYSPEPTDNPYAYYADFFANRFPCTTLLYQSDKRIKTFMDMLESSGARGVILSGEKFCEYEYFEFPYLEKILKEKGIPCLRLEFGVDDVLNTEAYKTRVEAFAELLA